MKHHFTNSERLALEAYYYLRTRGQLQEGFSDMEASGIRETEWRSYPYAEKYERSLTRLITFRFRRLDDRYTPGERPYYLQLHLTGYETRCWGSLARRSHWKIEKVKFGYFTAITPETPDGIRWEGIPRETFDENHLLLWGFDADSDKELREPQRARA